MDWPPIAETNEIQRRITLDLGNLDNLSSSQPSSKRLRGQYKHYESAPNDFAGLEDTGATARVRLSIGGRVSDLLVDIMEAQGVPMTGLRKRLERLERLRSVQGKTARAEISRQVLGRVSDAELELLESAAHAQAQGRELTLAECAAAEAYASAVECDMQLWRRKSAA